jgi:hypothetical protein
MLLWERTGRTADLSNISFVGKQYVVYSTVLDIIEDQDFIKWLKSGTRRRLGDFSVDVENLQGRLAMKASKYQKLKDIAFETLKKGWAFKVGVSSLAYEQAVSDISRLWYNVNNRYTWNEYKFLQDDIPGSNVTINRWAKTNNPMWW